MAKEYVFKDKSTAKVIFRCVEEDRVDPRDVAPRVLAATGKDPRCDKSIACEIRQVGPTQSVDSIGRFDRSKKLW
jgi:hypothetical protein